jgi:hypothetical protein
MKIEDDYSKLRWRSCHASRFKPQLGFVVLAIFSAGCFSWRLPSWLAKTLLAAGMGGT